MKSLGAGWDKMGNDIGHVFSRVARTIKLTATIAALNLLVQSLG